MHEAFVPLRAWLEPAQPLIAEMPVEEHLPDDEAEPCAVSDPEPVDACRDADDALADVRRFRAALADALDLKAQELLREIACEVLGREVHEGIDVGSIVARAVERYGAPPVRLRVSDTECDAARATGYETVADPTLRCGDVVLELAYGSIDARLGSRLERVLAGIS